MTASRLKLIVVVICFAGLIAGKAQPAVTVPAADTSGASGPRIEFDSTNLDFGSAAMGQIIVHNFIFTNTGSRVLEIQDVRPTCGCTIAGKWSRQVEPGKTGVVPIRFTPYKAEEVSKTVIVECNDSARTNVVLQLRGTIYELVEIKPAYVLFNVSAAGHTNQTRVVHIVNHMDQPLALSNPECADRSFQTSLKTIKPGNEYELQVTLVPPSKSGTITVPITLKTSATNLPAITITGVAAVQAPITASPSEITLSPGPLRSGVQARVTIQNNCSKPLSLSGTTVNIPGVVAKLREIQPGLQFVLTADFPTGFLLQNGAGVRVRIQTDNPEVPVITVPISQNQRLATKLNATENDSNDRDK
jgi:hypothetical protein